MVGKILAAETQAIRRRGAKVSFILHEKNCGCRTLREHADAKSPVPVCAAANREAQEHVPRRSRAVEKVRHLIHPVAARIPIANAIRNSWTGYVSCPQINRVGAVGYAPIAAAVRNPSDRDVVLSRCNRAVALVARLALTAAVAPRIEATHAHWITPRRNLLRSGTSGRSVCSMSRLRICRSQPHQIESTRLR